MVWFIISPTKWGMFFRWNMINMMDWLINTWYLGVWKMWCTTHWIAIFRREHAILRKLTLGTIIYPCLDPYQGASLNMKGQFRYNSIVQDFCTCTKKEDFPKTCLFCRHICLPPRDIAVCSGIPQLESFLECFTGVVTAIINQPGSCSKVVVQKIMNKPSNPFHFLSNPKE
jgi:hypothetical protein